MPIIKSAKKRVRVARKATARNVKTKRSLKTAVKALHSALTSGKKVVGEHRSAQSAIDRAAKNKVIHKNKAARKKSQLSRAAKAAAGASKSTAPKKTTAKKSPAKKPAAKKKPATKKK
jgi:small subunit ribosomal protein S20